MAGEVIIPVAYASGTSWFHKLHPIPKLIWAIGALVLAFSTRNPLFLSCFFSLWVPFNHSCWHPQKLSQITINPASDFIVFHSSAVTCSCLPQAMDINCRARPIHYLSGRYLQWNFTFPQMFGRC